MVGIDGALFDRLKPGPRTQALVRGFLDILMPPVSLDGGERPLASGLSDQAWSRIRFLEDPVCDGCGLAFEHQPGRLGLDRCPACLAQPHVFQRARAACVYDEGSRDLILAFKHADRLEHAPLFTRWLSRAAAPLIEEADAIVPVPLHWTRLLRRRANQAAEIARPLARLGGRAYLADALIRARATPTQGGKSARGRRLNVKGVFAVPTKRALQIRGRRILLVDDVLTTGATADACARVLLDAGARAVDVAVIARVRSRP
ncbi:MAG: ComF family protein [Caulobacterales bacterium]|nr:ComF family protein [Caulobacterales bacterium]